MTMVRTTTSRLKLLRRLVRLQPIVLLLCLVPFNAASPQSGADSQRFTAFSHVTLIDVNAGTAKQDYTVLARGNLIDQVGPSGRFPIPDGAQVVNGKDRFLVPGLWDMHVHIGSNERLLPLYVANGVTAVRSMADSVPDIRKFRGMIERGEITGPRIIATAGEIVDGPHPVWPGSVLAEDEPGGRAAVDRVVGDGAEFVKVYEMLPHAAFLGVANQANAKHIAFVGHLPMSVTASEASDAGQRSIEHLIGIPLACSFKEAYLRKEMLDILASATSLWPAFRSYHRADAIATESYSPEKASTVFSAFVKNGTWVVPTLTNVRASIYSDDRKFVTDPRLKLMPDNLLKFWAPNGADLTLDESQAKSQSLRDMLDLVGSMHRSGVEILAGTDTPSPFSFPGFGLHDELKLLVEAGFTPLEALRAATRDAARFMRLLDSYGTIDKFKVADLVLLDANPLDDIGNVGRISAVFTQGRLFSKEGLKSLLGAGARQ